MKLLFFLIWAPCTVISQHVINNAVTKSHTRVDGTNLYLVVPDGFAWTPSSREFVNQKLDINIIVNVLEIPIDQLHLEMSKDQLLSQGSILVSDEPIMVNNLKGFLIETKHQTSKEKFSSHFLIFGDFKTSYVLQSIFPEGNKSLELVSHHILQSTVYKAIVGLYQAPYSFDLKKYSFEFGENRDGIDYYNSKATSGMVVCVDYFSTKGNTDPGIIFYSRMQRLPFSSVELDENGIEEIEISDQKGQQATINATNDKGDAVYIYQVLLSDQEKHYLIQGTTASKENLIAIKDLIKTFKKLN